MGAILWPFLIYWMVLFVACYTVCEVAQDQLYDAVTPYVGLKVAAGSAILAVLLTWLRPSFDSMFTTNIMFTVLQGIVWFGVFTLIFQFHPWHALALGLVTMLMVPGLATMGVDSLTKPRTVTSSRPAITQPVRRAIGGAQPPVTKGATPAAK